MKTVQLYTQLSHLISLLCIDARFRKKKQNEQDAECQRKEKSRHQRPAGQLFVLAHIITSDYTRANILAGVQAVVNIPAKKTKKK